MHFTDVIAILLREPDAWTRFLKIETLTKSGERSFVKLTTTHNIFVHDAVTNNLISR